MTNLHDKHFTNETTEYRNSRNELLEAEINLRRQTEKTAELRRKLPQGGKLKEDYVFEETDEKGNVKQTKLSELFAPGKDILVIYNFMFAPDAKGPCVMCNSILDGLDGMIFHAEQRINFAAVAKAPVEKFKKWGDSRGWKNLRLLSSNKNTYNFDYFGENEKGAQMPMLNVFRKTPDGIFHLYGTEMLFASSEKGGEPRHVDSIWPLWNLFDFTPDGRGTDWYPKYKYDN